MVVEDKTSRMLGKLQVQFVSNFQISMSFLSIYFLFDGNIIHLSFLCVFSLMMFGGQTMVEES